ncbi:uncharacterized protein EDB93DRAFT_1246763 [Suillus bovinus]|uniref:uncharacterized protein n=1 Tax=Suillus bovinus TaxID=48563 RepID=UPI001B86DD7A|nr:uncharacterized protein EDB93DRAFT_1246763 [Suillus bovinus]KAG2157708.1 hypothetical protein EDB93DRAFT_1246763 [Suillus bovinus]
MQLHDGPSNKHTKVQQIKLRPITKESKGKMRCALCMAYSHSDESEVDEGKKVDIMIAKSAVSPGLINAPTETSQEDLTKELHDDRPTVDQQEPPQIANPVEDLPDATHNSHDPHDPLPEPVHHDPCEGVQQDPHKNDPPHNPQEPHQEVGDPLHNLHELHHEVISDRRNNHHEVDPLRELYQEVIPDRDEGDPPQEYHHEVIPDCRDNPHEGDPLRNPCEPRDTFCHDPRNPLPDPRQPLCGHSGEPWYMQDAMRHDHELHHLHEDNPIINSDALHPRDAFYYHDTHNLHYTSLQTPDHYGPNEPRTDIEFTGRDSSPALELHHDAHYAHVLCLVPTMLGKVNMLDMMTLTSNGHLVEELTMTVGTHKPGLVTTIPDGWTMSVILILHLWTMFHKHSIFLRFLTLVLSVLQPVRERLDDVLETLQLHLNNQSQSSDEGHKDTFEPVKDLRGTLQREGGLRDVFCPTEKPGLTDRGKLSKVLPRVLCKELYVLWAILG